MKCSIDGCTESIPEGQRGQAGAARTRKICQKHYRESRPAFLAQQGAAARRIATAAPKPERLVATTRAPLGRAFAELETTMRGFDELLTGFATDSAELLVRSRRIAGEIVRRLRGRQVIEAVERNVRESNAELRRQHKIAFSAREYVGRAVKSLPAIPHGNAFVPPKETA